ncbi:methyltransferase [Mycobacterium phage Donkeykong]|uniref:Methyltransferase n=1 Tax=Mycobacterium phage Donkeykong TaxID=2656572 RepID=A0A649VEV6_9CAUD|nr:methyltransferase [Mycobacterium phage Donkeykong]QGJ90861.1 methyltransferase [Mycobacterium phage Donkeykong]
MTLYYEDDQVQLFHGDCLEITEWLAADVLVTDPPYGTAGGDRRGNDGYGRRVGNQRGTERVGQHIANDGDTDVRDQALMLWGHRRPKLIFGSPRMPEPPGLWADRLVWDKKRPGINGGPWRYRHESIFVSAGFERRNNESMSILAAWPDQADHIHAKPLALMTALIECAPPGTIADPFAGSGSTLVAARNLGRKAIGVELEERYCEILAKRLDQMCLDFGDPA